MEARTMMGREAKQRSQRGRIVGAETRRILAVGKRVDHRWLVEMSIRPYGTASTRRGAAAIPAA